MSWNRKHLLDIESLSAEEIVTVLDTARAFKAVGERAIKKVPALRGKTVVNLFVEPSTRTRTSFALAATRLSADVVNFTAEASSLKKGETLKDTARNLEALNADIFIVRHSSAGASHFLARVLEASVVNAGGPAFTLIINGTGFVPGATVQIAGTTYTVAGVTATQITVFLPATLITQPQTLQVTVTNPGGAVSNSVPLTNTRFSVTSISPSPVTASIPAFVLTITGDFDRGDTV